MKKIITILLGTVLIHSCSTNTDSNGNSTTTFETVTPTLNTKAVSSIVTTTAVSGGTISSDGGAVITERGVCWGTSTNPTIALSTKTTDGIGTGDYISTISGLSPTTIYYVRAYATNSKGTAYGTELSFTTLSTSVTDIDGNTYQSVTICGQTWTKTNLNVSKYRNGDLIPQVSDPTAWASTTTGAWCYYNNDPAIGAVYGKLYNWYAVHDSRGLAPVGYHIPTDTEWTTLTDCLGGRSVAGGKLKENGTMYWRRPNTGATNSSGFTALPGGGRYYQGAFYYIGSDGNWWSSSEYSSTSAWDRDLNSGSDIMFRDTPGNKNYGWSVRCLKD